MTKTCTLLVLSSLSFLISQAQQTMQKTLYHEYDKTEMTSGSQKELADFVQQLKSVSVISISIRSYADKNGTSGYNQHLSEQRSLYILKTLQSQLSGSIFYTVNHFGEDDLVTQADNGQSKNRRSMLSVTYKTEEQKTGSGSAKPVIELTPYTEDVEEQRYNINLDDSVFIKGKDGTLISFASGTMQIKKGEAATGKATAFLKEYYEPGDILLSGVHSESDKGLLQTGGMFKFVVIQNGDTMLAETQKPVRIQIPDRNNLSGRMNVFTMNHGDTGLWNDTRELFSYTRGYWAWPATNGKFRDLVINKELPFNRWQNGKEWTEECNVSVYLFDFLTKRSDRVLAKHITYTLIKKDSETLSVHVSEKFRRCGVKQFYTKRFDTTFQVDYVPPYYETRFSNMSFINCDQFLNAPEVTNFYVKTPDCKGSYLLVYFKNLNAFMSVPYSKGMFAVHNVPPNEKVLLFASGKSGEDYYCGKKEFTITKNAKTELSVEKTTHEDMKKMLSVITYNK